MPRKSSATYLSHSIAFFSIFASRGIIASFFPLYLKQIGLNAQQIGIVMCFRQLGGVLGGVICPQMSAKLQGEKNTMLVCSWMFLLLFFAVNWIAPTSAEFCPSNNYNTPNTNSSNSTSNGDISVSLGYLDRKWMFRDNDVLMAVVLCSVLILCAELFSVGVKSIQHGITLGSLGKEHSGRFGLIRAWGALGHSVAVVTAGLVVSGTVRVEKICTVVFTSADYHAIFYVYVTLCAISIVNTNVIVGGISDVYSDEAVLMSREDLWKALCTFQNISWLLVWLCRSAFYSVTQGFLNWHMENLGASPALIGLSNCVTTTTEFVMFFATPKLLEIFGHTKLVTVGILSYVCRFIIFSLISNPVYIIPVEFLEGVMYACVVSSVVSHLSNQVPEEGQIQVQGLIQALYMLGTGIGFPISGLLTQIFGAPVMFLVFAGLALVTFFAFTVARFAPEMKR